MWTAISRRWKLATVVVPLLTMAACESPQKMTLGAQPGRLVEQQSAPAVPLVQTDRDVPPVQTGPSVAKEGSPPVTRPAVQHAQRARPAAPSRRTAAPEASAPETNPLPPLVDDGPSITGSIPWELRPALEPESQLTVQFVGDDMIAPSDPSASEAGAPELNPTRAPMLGKDCECPFDVDDAGQQCGEESAWALGNGIGPVCYAVDWGEAGEMSETAARGPAATHGLAGPAED